MTGSDIKANKPTRSIGAKWSDVVLVCRKCSKKLDGGFGKKGDVPLEKALKARWPGKGAPKVLTVPCMDICPKRAVCVVRGSDARRVHLVAQGTPVGDVMALLGAPNADAP